MKPLNPIMAALLAASSASFALPGTAVAKEPAAAANATAKAAKAKTAAQKAAAAKAIADAKAAAAKPGDAGHAQAVKDLNFVLPRLIELVDRNADARKDIGERLAKFIQGKSAGQQYLTDGLLKDETLLKAAVAVAKEWPEKSKDKSGKVAALYFVIGPETDQLPAWAPAEFKDRFKPGMEWGVRLAAVLTSVHWSDSRRVAQQDAANGTVAFLNDAADRAQKIVDDTRTKEEAAGSVEDNNVTATQPPVVGRPNPLDTTGSGFGFNDLYGPPGAIVQKVYGAGDDGYRTLSMKMYTIMKDGKMQNFIGIVDITAGDPNAPYKPTFIPMTQSGNSKVSLREGGRKYSLSIGMENGEHTVTFGRAGGQGIVTSMEKLANARAEQASRGGIVSIPSPDGPKFYAMGQGGENGSVLFFPKDDVDNRASIKDARYLRPATMGNVSQLDADGLTVPMEGKPPMGKVNGQPYHLEFDFTTKMWRVTPGEGDKPAAVAKEGDPKAGQTADGQTPAPAGATGQQTAAPEGATLEQVVALAKQAGWNETGNEEFSPEAKAKIRITSMVKGADGRFFNVYFDPSLNVPTNQYAFAQVLGKEPLKNIRGFKNYVVLQFPKSAQYFPYADFAKYVSGTQVSPMIISPASGGMQNIKDVDVAIDVLKHLYGVNDQAMFKTIRERVAKHVKSGEYLISGSSETLAVGLGKDRWTVWPDDVKLEDVGDNAGMTGLRGPGTAVSLVGAGRGPFKKDMDMPGNRTAALIEGQDHAAIYKGKEDESLPTGEMKTADVWYLMVDYKKNGADARTKPLPVFGGQDRYALPKGYGMQGLEDVDLPDTAQLMLLHGSTQEKGAIAAYRTALPDAQGGQNVKDKKGNCGGAVLWWGGVTKQQAQKACETDSKVP